MSDVDRNMLEIVPVTPDRLGDLGDLFKGTDAATCWDMVQRTTAAEERERVARWKGSGTSVREGRRSCFAALAAGSRAPGLIAYLADRPVGWISVGPRSDYPRVAMSRATPPVDDAHVWIIPCLLVRREHRSQGITRALIEAAARYAAAHGADALEAYPRPDEDRPSASSAFLGTVGLFRKAGFEVVRAPLDGLPKAWVRRFAVRRTPLT